jgi:thymidine kinase
MDRERQKYQESPKKHMTIYTGPMFSGKSERTRVHLEQLDRFGIDYCVLKPSLDTRKENSYLTHDGKEIEAYNVGPFESIKDMIRQPPSFVVVDEIQFFTGRQVADIVSFKENSLCNIIANGLNLDWKGNPFAFQRRYGEFKTMQDLFDVTDHIVYLYSICRCGRIAEFSHRISYSSQLVEIGGSEQYTALCRNCFSGSQKA